MNTCHKYSIYPQVIEPQKRIIAIGDIHGDFNYLIHTLKIARVISDTNYKWIGGSTYVVQLGDQIDNCRPEHFFCYEKGKTPNDKADDLKIIDFLDDLNKQARASHGAVISLLGNHELLNIEGDLGYVSYENLQKVDGKENRKDLFNYKGKYGEKLICTHPPAVIIGSNLFVHAGVLPNMIDQLPTLRDILKISSDEIIDQFTNTELAKVFIKMCLSNTFNKEGSDNMRNKLKLFDAKNKTKWESIFKQANNKINIDAIFKRVIKKQNVINTLITHETEIREILKLECNKQVMIMHSIEVINSVLRNWLLQKINRQYLHTVEPYYDIFWTRILGSIPSDKSSVASSNETCTKYVNPVLEFFKVKNMVIAHTPQFMANQKGINNVCNSVWRTDIGGAEVFNKYDTEWVKTGKNMKHRIPQVLEIINDNEFKVLQD